MNLKDYKISDLVRHYNRLAGGVPGPGPKPLNHKAVRRTLEELARAILETCEPTCGTAEWDEAASNEVAALGGLASVPLHGAVLKLLIAGIDGDPLFSAPKLRGLALVFLRDATLALDPQAAGAAGQEPKPFKIEPKGDPNQDQQEEEEEGLEEIASTALTLVACKLNALVEEADQEGLFQVIDGLDVLLTVLASMTGSAPRADSVSELEGVLHRCEDTERATAAAQSAEDPTAAAD